MNDQQPEVTETAMDAADELAVEARLKAAGATLTLHVAPDGRSVCDYMGDAAFAVRTLREVADSLAEAHGVRD